jgi:hypothetical protein
MPSQPPTVFISYSHHSPEHAQHVLELAKRLRKGGVISHIDQYVAATTAKKDWLTRWISEFDQKDLLTEKLIRESERKLRKSIDFSNVFSEFLLHLVPLKHLERAYEPSKCDAEANRLERLEKDGNEAAANWEYRREINKVRLNTLLTLPRFLIGEIWGQVRRCVSVLLSA